MFHPWASKRVLTGVTSWQCCLKSKRVGKAGPSLESWICGEAPVNVKSGPEIIQIWVPGTASWPSHFASLQRSIFLAKWVESSLTSSTVAKHLN